MAVSFEREEGSFILDSDYEINIVRLSKKEEEHTHKFIELVYTIHGDAIHYVDDKEYHIKSGDMLLINYHCRHTVIPVGNPCYVDIMLKPEYVNRELEGTEDLFLILQLRDFSDLSNMVIRDNILLHFDPEERKRMETLLDWTTEEQQKKLPAGNVIRHAALSMMLGVVFRKMAECQNGKLMINDTLLSYINRNCSNRISVSEMAGACGYTPEHFTRMFKKYTGLTPLDYISNARINRAKQLLRQTDKPIEAILGECGFSNRNVFFRRFVDSTGMTPLQYRKNQK